MSTNDRLVCECRQVIVKSFNGRPITAKSRPYMIFNVGRDQDII